MRAISRLLRLLVLLGVSGSALRPLAAQEVLRVDPSTGEQLYRNTEFKFRIRFPPAWTVADGDGAHVRKKATRRGAIVLVLVRDGVTPALIAEVKRAIGFSPGDSDAEIVADIRAELDSRRLVIDDYPAIDEVFQKFSDVEMVTRRLDRLDNHPCLFIHARMSYTAGGITVRLETLIYQLFYRGVLYQVQAGAPVEDFRGMRAVLERSLRTFVIEDWN